MQQRKIILIRHGHCEGGNILRGKTNVALSQAGWEQMQRAVQRLIENDVQVNAIVSSPLSRCFDFAAKTAKSLNMPLLIEKNLQEFNYGKWDGKSFDELYKQYDVLIDKFFENPWQNPPPNGETMAHFEKRVNDAYKMLCHQSTESPCIWVFTHGGVIKQIISRILKLTHNSHVFSKINIPYGGVISISLYFEQGEFYSNLQLGG